MFYTCLSVILFTGGAVHRGVRRGVQGGEDMHGGEHAWWEHGRGAHMVGAWQEGMHLGDTATEAGGMHPTGMHSCYGIVSG